MAPIAMALAIHAWEKARHRQESKDGPSEFESQMKPFVGKSLEMKNAFNRRQRVGVVAD